MHHRASQGSLILAHPNFIIPMMLAKVWPHRDALAYAFQKVPKPDNDPSELQWTYLVIVEALVSLSRTDISIMEPWFAGPGRGTTHHSGQVVYSHTVLQILTQCDGEMPRNKRKGVVLILHRSWCSGSWHVHSESSRIRLSWGKPWPRSGLLDWHS